MNEQMQAKHDREAAFWTSKIENQQCQYNAKMKTISAQNEQMQA